MLRMRAKISPGIKKVTKGEAERCILPWCSSLMVVVVMISIIITHDFAALIVNLRHSASFHDLAFLQLA
jgi:hypothetical protein